MAAANTQEAAIRAVLDQTNIEGLDIADALERLNNSAAIFMRIIRSFVSNMPAILAELANPTAENLADYAIKVHGCKGSLYGIGATQIGNSAKALEIASKAGDLPAVQRDNAAFISSVEALIQQLHELEVQVEAATVAASTAEATQQQAAVPDKGLLTQLLEATRVYDMDAMAELIERLASQTYASGGQDVTYIKEQFEAFAYDLVEQRLEQML